MFPFVNHKFMCEWRMPDSFFSVNSDVYWNAGFVRCYFGILGCTWPPTNLGQSQRISVGWRPNSWAEYGYGFEAYPFGVNGEESGWRAKRETANGPRTPTPSHKWLGQYLTFTSKTESTTSIGSIHAFSDNTGNEVKYKKHFSYRIGTEIRQTKL